MPNIYIKTCKARGLNYYIKADLRAEMERSEPNG